MGEGRNESCGVEWSGHFEKHQIARQQFAGEDDRVSSVGSFFRWCRSSELEDFSMM